MDIVTDTPAPVADLPWTAISLAVLQTLNAGLKDEVAARRLSVSLRTYRRRIAELMDYFGVNTRFELGVRVAEVGLLRHHRPGRRHEQGSVVHQLHRVGRLAATTTYPICGTSSRSEGSNAATMSAS